MSFDYGTLFAPILADIENEMRAIRDEQRTIAPIMWAIIDYQFGWDAEAASIDKNISGKRIRPVMMALVAQAVYGRYEHVLPAGAALELLHNFTLIHDDVMDKSPERRHRPAVWTRWGGTQAINAGDGLYALANLAMTRLLDQGADPVKTIKAHRAMSQACLWTAEGQMLDIDFETREVVRAEEYITMIVNKTGTLIEAAGYIGALLSTDDEAVAQGYAAFARNLGVAFQIRDDYLDVWGDTAQTGKVVASDIRDKKKSYPVLVALERAGEADRATLSRIYAQDVLADDDVQTVLDVLGRVDAAGQTDQTARHYYDLAMQSLASTGINNDTQHLIRQLAEFLIQRAH